MPVQAKDIEIAFDTTLMEGDFSFNSSIQDLTSESGIKTSVIISLFTDRKAEKDDVLPDSNNSDRRGWWGDLTSPETENDRIGSRLWLLSREKTLETVLVKAKQYAEEALEWMVEDKIVSKIEIKAERQGTIGNDILALLIQIHTIKGSIYTISLPDIINAVSSSVTFGGDGVLFGGEEVIW